mmetsp:Transcript_28994/g.47874  ORF Transcript_28994/g.47874 Transcript_28994/m.47874 type:complete len:217 (+) Transcript_28994:140-790(+)
MNHNINIIIASTEQVVSFNNLKSLIHHCGTVEGDLGTHIPVRVRRCLSLYSPWVFFAHFEQLILAEITERPTRSSQDHTTKAAFWHSLEALENGTVLRVGWQHVDAVLLHEWKDHWSSTDKSLLVGKSDVLTELDSFNSGFETGGSDNAGNDSVSSVNRRTGEDTLISKHDFWHILAPSTLQAFLELVGSCFGSQRSNLWAVLHDLLSHEFGVVSS